MQRNRDRLAGALWLGLVAVVGCASAAQETRPAPSQATSTAEKPAYDAKALARQMRTIDALIARGETAKKDAFVASVATEKDSPAARFLTAYQNDDRNVAWRELDGLRKKLPGSPLGYLGIEAVYVEWRIVEEAERAYAKTAQMDAGLAVAHARMGALYLNKGDTAKAEALFTLALRSDPDDGDALVGLARLSRTAGRKDEALGHYERAAGAWPESLAIARERAELLEEMGRKKDAAEAYLAAARLDRRPFEVLIKSASLKAQDGDRAGAEQVYTEALRHNPNDPELLATLGKLAAERGDLEAQRSYFARAVEGKPDDLEMQRTLAQAYVQKGEMSGAERHFQEVVRLKPDDQPAHLALARLYAQARKYREALEHFREAGKTGALDEATAAEIKALEETLMLSTTPATGKDVQKTFDAALKTIVAAYEKRLKDVPDLKGEVTVEVDVGEDGSVASAKLKDDSLKDDVLLANIYFTIKAAQFPAGKKARYSYPISFTGPAGKRKAR